MYTNQTRVHSINLNEFKLAHELYSSYIEEGYTPSEVVQKLIGTKHYQLMKNYFTLLDVTTPHLQQSAVVVKMRKMKKDAKKNIERETAKLEQNSKKYSEQILAEKRTKILNKEFADLKSKLVNLLQKNYSEFADAVYQYPENNVDLYIDNLISLIEKSNENRQKNQTSCDIIRVGEIELNGKSLQLNSNSHQELLEEFEKKLIEAGVDKTIAAFMVIYTNQKCINYGGLFFHETPLVELYPHLTKEYKTALKCHIDVDKAGNVTIRNEKLFSNFEKKNNLVQKSTQAKANIVLKITKNEAKKTARKHSEIEVQIEQGHLEIYDEKIHSKFLYHRIREIVAKIRNFQELVANDYEVINIYLSQFKNNQGDLINCDKLDANTVFLLGWSNVADAEELFVNQPLLLKKFFTRSSKEIKEDFNLILDKHNFYPELEKECEFYYKNLDLIDSNNWSVIEHNLQNGNRNKTLMCMLSLADANLVKNSIKEVLTRKELMDITIEQFLIDCEQDPLLDVEKRKSFLQKIKNYLTGQKVSNIDDILKEIEQKVTVTEKNINQILDQSNLKNNLEYFVLSKYALMNERIATKVLQQSMWERFVVAFKSFFMHSPHLEVAAKRFRSTDLRHIIEKFPNLWQSAFARKKRLNPFFRGGQRDYRESLSKEDLHKLIDIKKADNDSFTLTANHIVNGQLFKKIEEKIDFKEAVQLKKLLPTYTFNLLAKPAKDDKQTLWDQMHLELSAEELYDFYQYKLEQEYEKNHSSDLVLTIVDFWADNHEVEGIAFWRSDVKQKARQIREFNKEPNTNYPDPHLIMCKAIVDVVANNKAKVYLDNFVPNAGNHQDSISKKQMKELHRQFLSNYSLLTSLLKEPKFCANLASHKYLYKIAIETAKQHQDMQMLHTIYNILPRDQILKHLQISNECDYLAERMILDEAFFNNMLLIMNSDQKIMDIFWLKAKPYQLYLLLLAQADKISDVILSNPVLAAKLVDHISIAELAQLISKYPYLLPKFAQISMASSKDEEKFKERKESKENKDQQPLKEKITQAVLLCRGTISTEKMTKILAHDADLGLMLKKHETELIKGIYNENSSHLFAAEPLDLLAYLKTSLSSEFKKEAKEEFICRVAYNRELLNKIIQPANIHNFKDCEVLNEFLRTLIAYSESTKSKELLLSFHHIIDSLLLMIINQPNVSNTLLRSQGFKELAFKYGNVELLALLVLQNNKDGKINLGDYQQFLEKLIGTDFFEKFLPTLLFIKDFSNWILSYILQGKLTKLNSQGKPFLSSEYILKLLQNADWSGDDFADELIRQYQYKITGTNKLGVPDLRSLLLNNAAMRTKVLTSFSGASPEKLLDIFMKEKLLGDSVILDQILSRPLFDYLLDKLNPERLNVLFIALFDDKNKLLQDRPFLLQAIKQCYFDKKHFRKFILSSENFFKQLLNQFDYKEPDYHRIILDAFSMEKLTPQVIEIANTNGITIARGFMSHAKVEDTIKLLLMASSHNLDRVVKNIIESPEIFQKFLANDVQPKIQAQFLLWCLDLIHKSELNSDNHRYAKLIAQHLSSFKSDADKFYLDLSVDQLIDLYINDGFEIEPKESNSILRPKSGTIKKQYKYLVRDYIRQNTSYHLLDQLLLNGTDQKLIEVFKVDKSVQNFFVEKICSDSELGKKFADRMLTNYNSSAPNMIEFMILNFNIETQIKLIKHHPQIREKVINHLKLKPELLLSKDMKIYMYVKFIVEHENTACLEFLINATNNLKASNDNDVMKCFIATLDDQQLSQKALSHIYNTSVQQNNNLVEMMFALLSGKEIVELCKFGERVETKLVAQMMAKPAIAERLAKTGDLILFFNTCKQPLSFYLHFMYRANVKPDIIQLLQRELADNNVLKDKILKLADSSDLALLVNAEHKSLSKPLTRDIYKSKELKVSMLKSAEKLNGALTITSEFRDVLKVDSSYKEFNKSFRIDFGQLIMKSKETKNSSYPNTQSLKFSSTNKIVSLEHGCSFIYSLYMQADETKQFYHQFFVPMTHIVHLDDKGVLKFNYVDHEVGKEVPLRYAMFYYDALARLNFYDLNDSETQKKSEVPNLQILLETKPELVRGFINSVSLDKENFVYKKFDERKTLGPVPAHYRDAVLYAKCLSPEFEEEFTKFPQLADIYLDSVTVNDSGKILFKNAAFPVPEKYLAVIQKIARQNLYPEKKSSLIKLVAALPNIDELLTTDKKLCQYICAHVFYDAEGNIKFHDTEEKVPNYYKEILLTAIINTKNAKSLLELRSESPALKNEIDKLITAKFPQSQSRNNSLREEPKKPMSGLLNRFSHWKNSIKTKKTKQKPVIEPLHVKEIKVK